MESKIKEFKFYQDLNHSIKKSLKCLYFSKTECTRAEHLVLFFTEENRVYSTGSNYCGKLGLGHNNDVIEAIEIKEFNGQVIVEIFESESCVFARNNRNQIFGWGGNGWGQLARGFTTDWNHECDQYLKPEMIDFGINEIINVSCGNIHYLALSVNGTVYGWGNNNFGQISKKPDEKVYPKPEIINFGHLVSENEKVKYIFCYAYCSFALTTGGKVIFWGQFGWDDLKLNKDSINNIVFPPIMFDWINVSKICCTDIFVYFIIDQQLYNFYGEELKLIYSKDDVIDIAAFENNLIIIKTKSETEPSVHEIREILDDKDNFEKNEVFTTKYSTLIEYFLSDHGTSWKMIQYDKASNVDKYPDLTLFFNQLPKFVESIELTKMLKVILETHQYFMKFMAQLDSLSTNREKVFYILFVMTSERSTCKMLVELLRQTGHIDFAEYLSKVQMKLTSDFENQTQFFIELPEFVKSIDLTEMLKDGLEKLEYLKQFKAPLESFSTKREKVFFILFVMTRERSTYRKLVELLRETGQTDVADRLNYLNLSKGPMKLTIDIKIPVKKGNVPKMGSNCYNLLSKSRGKCIIINNLEEQQTPDIYNERGEFQHRPKGLKRETERFEYIFKELFFEVQVLKNLNAIKMKQKLSEISKDKDFKNSEAFVVIVISHGENEQVLGYNACEAMRKERFGLIRGSDFHEVQQELNRDVISIKEVIKIFCEENCPQLKLVPKLYFFICCRGKSSDTENIKSWTEKVEEDEFVKVVEPKNLGDGPNLDTFVSYVCSEGLESFYNSQWGLSFFGQAFTHSIAQYACVEPLSGIMSRTLTQLKTIYADIKEAEEEGNKNSEVPVPALPFGSFAIEVNTYAMDRQLYFNPGIVEESDFF